MKHLSIFLLALVLTAGVASAQSTATTTQSGVQNQATVDQTGSNSAIVTQNGDKSIADVDQSGTGNTGTVTQTDNSAIVPNSTHSAILDQVGTDNDATITQTNMNSGIANNGSDADVEQDGSNHKATVIQGTRTQYAEINQTNNGGGELGNEAIIQQSSNEGGTAYVDQIGQSNYANTHQRGGGANDSDVEQTGTGNIANVRQDIDTNIPASPVEAISNVKQDGTANVADVEQTLSVHAEAHITQQGANNEAKVEQWNPTSINPSHYASISQTNGDLNYGRILQGGNASARNWASISQLDGDANRAFLDQKGLGGDHMATVTQEGSNNRVEGLGGLGTAALQDGFDHTLTVSQMGDGHVAQTSQVGSSNTTTITQN